MSAKSNTTTASRLKVAIVNDLAVACEALRRAVVQDPAFEVMWTAKDGAQAIEMAARERPDLILMDLIMPRVNGVEATRAIMRATPCPILVVTATVSGNAALVFEALGAGALDAVNTPSFGEGALLKGGEELLRRMHLVARVARGERSAATLAPTAVAVAAAATPTVQRTRAAAAPMATRAAEGSIIAIGASTGGPRAIADVLLALPPKTGASILVVQHLSTAFVEGFADWLGTETHRRVVCARAGDALRADEVLIAAEDRHMVLSSDGVIEYRDEPRASLHRPSVDELFSSLATSSRRGVAVLLTGMGSDGAEGLLRLRRAGWHTIAQDQKTSVVWGMPGAAHALGAAVETLALPLIASATQARLV